MLPCAVGQWWARQGSNLRPIGYEPTALPLSYRPGAQSSYPSGEWGVKALSPTPQRPRALRDYRWVFLRRWTSAMRRSAIAVAATCVVMRSSRAVWITSIVVS